MRKIGVVFACLLLGACGAPPGSDQPSVTKASLTGALKPKSTKVTWTIDANRLESEALNFRIAAPAGYTWRNEMDEDGKYLFTANNGTDKVRLLIQGRNFEPTTENHAYEYVNGMRGEYENLGLTVQDVLVSRRRSKLGTGYSYFFRAVHGDRAARVTGYLVSSDRLYSVEHTSAAPADVLGPFVSSLAPMQ